MKEKFFKSFSEIYSAFHAENR